MSRRTLQQAPNPQQAPPVSTATRRDLFGTMGALLLLSATEAGQAKASELDGELLALCDEAVALHQGSVAATDAIDAPGLMQGSPKDEAAWEAAYARSATWRDLCEEIAALPARTPEGLVGKARVLRRVVALEEPLVASLCRDLLGRVGA